MTKRYPLTKEDVLLRHWAEKSFQAFKELSKYLDVVQTQADVQGYSDGLSDRLMDVHFEVSHLWERFSTLKGEIRKEREDRKEKKS